MGQRRGTEAAFIEWDRKIIHVFADSGLYILSSPVLGEPVLGPLKPERWNIMESRTQIEPAGTTSRTWLLWA